ncbi:MAG TPA: hypothetical protein VMW08_05170 [Acidimicrobiales bacterium]|nr:hypothetical protein [Acidimicrobiales bacterium]
MASAAKTRQWSTADTLRLLASAQTDGDDVIDLVAIERTLAFADARCHRFLDLAKRREVSARDDELESYVPRHLKKA